MLLDGLILLGGASDGGLACAHFGCVVDEHGLELQGFRKQEVPDVVASDGNVIKRNRLSALHSQLNRPQVSVHRYIHTGHSAHDHSAILQLDCHRLVVQLHQKAHQLHFIRLFYYIIQEI